MEKEVKTAGIEPIPFDEKARRFESAVQGVALGVGGGAEDLFREYGHLIVEYHKLGNDEEREKFKKEELDVMYDNLAKATEYNPKAFASFGIIKSLESILS